MFSFSFFSQPEATVPPGPPAAPPDDAVPEKSFGDQIFSFFAEPAPPTDPDKPGVEEVTRKTTDSPVAKTLSEMAQTISDMADETIRSLSPATIPTKAPPVKLSYRRKTVFAPPDILPPISSPKLEKSATVPAPALKEHEDTAVPTNTADVSVTISPTLPESHSPEPSHKYPSYGKTKPQESAPLLTAITRNRPSVRKREHAVAEIASKAKSSQAHQHEDFHVSDFGSGMQKKLITAQKKVTPLDSINEGGGTPADSTENKTVIFNINEEEEEEGLVEETPELDNEVFEPYNNAQINENKEPRIKNQEYKEPRIKNQENKEPRIEQQQQQQDYHHEEEEEPRIRYDSENYLIESAEDRIRDYESKNCKEEDECSIEFDIYNPPIPHGNQSNFLYDSDDDEECLSLIGTSGVRNFRMLDLLVSLFHDVCTQHGVNL